MNTKIFFGIILFLALGGVYALLEDWSSKQVACTMEAKLCPDGSAVGRTGPACEFPACPDSPSGDGAGWEIGIPPFKSGIEGVVLRGPMCPVMRVGEECPDAAYQTEVVVYRAATNTEVFATVQSDTEGKFSVTLPPGEYVVNARNDGISKTCSDTLVTVGSKKIEKITISCDTGIR